MADIVNTRKLYDQQFEIVRLAVGREFSASQLLANKQYAVRLTQQDARRMVVALEAGFAASKESHAKERVSYPATWWDHFKQRFADDWWFRWFAKRAAPVRFTTIEIDLMARLVFPDIATDVPEYCGSFVLPIRVKSTVSPQEGRVFHG